MTSTLFRAPFPSYAPYIQNVFFNSINQELRGAFSEPPPWPPLHAFASWSDDERAQYMRWRQQEQTTRHSWEEKVMGRYGKLMLAFQLLAFLFSLLFLALFMWVAITSPWYVALVFLLPVLASELWWAAGCKGLNQLALQAARYLTPRQEPSEKPPALSHQTSKTALS